MLADNPDAAGDNGGPARRLQQTDDGDCSTKEWALDAVAEIGLELGLEPGEVQVASCVRGTSATEQGTCDDPAYILNVAVILDPSLKAEESRCVAGCGAVLCRSVPATVCACGSFCNSVAGGCKKQVAYRAPACCRERGAGGQSQCGLCACMLAVCHCSTTPWLRGCQCFRIQSGSPICPAVHARFMQQPPGGVALHPGCILTELTPKGASHSWKLPLLRMM